MLKKLGAGNFITVVLVVVLMVAGILNWRYNNKQKDIDNAKILGEAAYVNNNVEAVDDESSFAALKIEKERRRDESIELLREITANPKSTENNIAEAQEKLTLMAFHNEMEANCEAILKARGILDDILVTVDNDSATVSVKTESLTPSQITAITEVVKEQTDFSADKIKISATR